MATKKHPQI
jgi:putative ABC transport system ATP-binding protein